MASSRPRQILGLVLFLRRTIYIYHNAHTYFRQTPIPAMTPQPGSARNNGAQRVAVADGNQSRSRIRKPTPLASRIGPSPPSSVTPTVSPTIFA